MSERQEEKSKNVNPEVPEKASRRRFDAAYKLKIVEEAERCAEPGQIGEMLRREGLYSSQRGFQSNDRSLSAHMHRDSATLRQFP